MVGESPNRNDVQTGGLHRLCAVCRFGPCSCCHLRVLQSAVASLPAASLGTSHPYDRASCPDWARPASRGKQAARLTQLRRTDAILHETVGHTLDSQRAGLNRQTARRGPFSFATTHSFTTAHPLTPWQSSSSLERSLKSADRDLSPGLADIVCDRNTVRHRTCRFGLRDRSTFLLDDLDGRNRQSTGRTENPIGTGPFVMTFDLRQRTRHDRGAKLLSRQANDRPNRAGRRIQLCGLRGRR